MKKYFNEKGEVVELGKEIACGGEGTVYDIDDSNVAKLYFDPKDRLSKMRAFINKGIHIKGVCIPNRLLFDENNNFVGFTMQKAGGKSLQSSIFQPKLFKLIFPNWTKIELTKLAITILKKIDLLHTNDILIGDINPFNINVVDYNEVYFLDTDSYQVDRFPCPVGTVDFTPPELQGINYSNFLRTKQHELYSVATLLFMIYLPGKHPYSRSGGGEKKENIKNHDFVFPLGDEDVEATPKGQWEAIWYSLPFDLRQSFYNVFKLNMRYPIKYWIEILYKYIEELGSNQYSCIIFPLNSEFISKDKTLNMNRRDITDKEPELRRIDTPLSNNIDPRNAKIGVIELSTKAVKLLIGNVPSEIRNKKFDFKMFIRDGVKTSTGRGLNTKNVMDMDYFRNNVLPIIQRSVKKAKEQGVDCLYSVATAAYRTATNRDEIIRCIKDEAGLNVRILKKEEEARATIDAYVFSAEDKMELMKHKYIMMIDQGGGSTEVSLFKNGEYVDSYSINLGTEVLRTLLFKESTEQTTLRHALNTTDKLIRERLDAFYTNMQKVLPIGEDIFTISVGTAITTATGRKGNAKQHGCVLTLESLIDKISHIDTQLKNEYTYVSDLYSDINISGTRADNIDRNVVMRIGLPMFTILMKKLGISQLTVSGTGLWYGIYFQNLYI